MKIIQLDSFEQLNEYDLSWNDLLSKSRDDYVFSTLEWLETWWKHFGAKRKLLLLAVERNKRILALAPLMETTYKLFGLKLRNIEFIGSPISDYLTFILIREGLICTRMVLNHIKQQRWDALELKNIPEHSETAFALKVNLDRPIQLKERVIDTCFFVPLANTFEEYLQKLNRKARKELRRTWKKLENEHKVELKSFEEFGSVSEAMRILFRLHLLRWKYKRQESVLANSTLRDFHIDVANRFAEKGWLRLYFMTVDDEPVSTLYCFEYKQRLYVYLAGFDPYYSKYGVGALTFLAVIKDCIKRGLKEFDMLRGEHSYKYIWKPSTRRDLEFSAVRLTPISKAYEYFVKSNIMPSLSSKLKKYALSRIIR